MSNTRTRKRPAKNPAQAPPPRSLTVWWIAGGVGLVLLLGAILLSVRGDGGPSEFGDPEVTGQELITFADPAGDPAVGAAIPTVAGAGFDGSPVTIEPGEGALAVLFLAHWCGHCQFEVPVVQEWLDSGGADDLNFTFRSVSTATSSARDNYPPSAWLEREGWSVPVVVDDASGTVATAYGLNAFPYWVIADADGNVTARRAGSVTLDELEALITAAGG